MSESGGGLGRGGISCFFSAEEGDALKKATRRDGGVGDSLALAPPPRVTTLALTVRAAPARRGRRARRGGIACVGPSSVGWDEVSRCVAGKAWRARLSVLTADPTDASRRPAGGEELHDEG